MIATDTNLPLPDAERARLTATWARRTGLAARVTTIHHQDLATRMVALALACGALAALLALPLRLQLAGPALRLVGPDAFSQLFTVHGTAMLFLFAVPAMQGLALYTVPLLIGARAVALPRLAAFGWWTYVAATVLLFGAAAANLGDALGWYRLRELAGAGELHPWPHAVTLAAIAASAGAVNLLYTAARMRAPGMTPRRVPVFVWATVVASLYAALAMPIVALGGVLLALGDAAGIAPSLFASAQGESALLFQRLFPFFAHPAAVVSLLVGAGVVSQVIETFSRRRLVGHTAALAALGTAAALALVAWAAHFLPTRPAEGTAVARLFATVRLLILVPAGVVVSSWIATLWFGRPRFTAALRHALAGVALLVPAAPGAAMLGSLALGQYLADTQFAVAQAHTLLFAGVLFPLLAGLAYWYPKWTGRTLDERLGTAALRLTVAGVIVAFAPLLRLGLLGMPSRVYSYAAAERWGGLNLLAAAGALLLVAGLVVVGVNLARSRARGRRVNANPWQAGTLEWATPSPPPRYGFLYPPPVERREPLWGAWPPPAVSAAALGTGDRWALVTTALTAQPFYATKVAAHSPWPPLLALLVAVTLAIATAVPITIPIGAALITLVSLRWFGDARRG